MNATIRHCYNLAFYRPHWWESAILVFCPLRIRADRDGVVWFKSFGNRMYIFGCIRQISGVTHTENGEFN